MDKRNIFEIQGICGFCGPMGIIHKGKKIVGSCSGNFTLPPAESATSVIDVTLFENGEQSQYTY